MTYVLVALLLAAAVIAALRLRRIMRDRAGAERPAPITSAAPLPAQPAAPMSPSTAPVQVAPQEVYRPAPTVTPTVSWDELDDETAERPQVDAELLRTARASVSRDIPDDVLEEMLFKATPQQTAQLLAGVSAGVMADLTADHGQGVHFEGQAREEDLAALSSLSSAVDDLDIWDFGEESGDKIRA
ncbi:hypothetical protein Deipr_0976 [Deinococcus proteolyticus MRP]|uniref:Uncharacterized protein n=1 Tax=Deinococcus proteolyticus (strain ATCC 35074 / DSM 20540 / JCM 6276 / NBRC 101906 / NCIMB 13154 / VKM Ac-1939 / CCM 2703 / MRP) TaxID=693977 RepID=F0RMZ0_DEIPM|nr:MULTISPECIES: hypothetical protein [Deinococcus]ADY26132.1 hypothetical protein Deipr_0976 [Deinococcus proteolyticus MRP]MCY1702252.1 hypothetical protein [Deinococcus sp. SL84]